MKTCTVPNSAAGNIPALISFSAWAQQVGIGTTCAYEWRKRGWIRTIDVAGRLYCTEEALREFYARAVRGEFAGKSPRGPRRAQTEAAPAAA